MMEIRRQMMGVIAKMAHGGNARMATGTFTNNDTSSVSLNVGFKPDVVYISCGYGNTEYSTAGWTGCALMVIIRNETILYYRHNNDSSTSFSVGVNNTLGGNYGEFGINNGTSYAPSQTFAAAYTDGVLAIENKTPNTAYTHFMADETYTWVAFATI